MLGYFTQVSLFWFHWKSLRVGSTNCHTWLAMFYSPSLSLSGSQDSAGLKPTFIFTSFLHCVLGAREFWKCEWQWVTASSDSSCLVAKHVLFFMLTSFLWWRLSLGEDTGSILVTLFLQQIKQFGCTLVLPRKTNAEGKSKLSLWRRRKSCCPRKDLSLLPIRQQHLHVCISSAFLGIVTVSKARQRENKISLSSQVCLKCTYTHYLAKCWDEPEIPDGIGEVCGISEAAHWALKA